jgi:hypothetical protein
MKEMMDDNLKEMKARLQAKIDANQAKMDDDQAILAKMNAKMEDWLEEGKGSQNR